MLLPKPGQPGWGLLAQEVPHRLGDSHFVLAGASTGCHSGQDERHCPQGERDSGWGGPHLTNISTSYFRFLSNPKLPLLSQSPTSNSSPKFIFYLFSFKPQNPQKSKEVSITLLFSPKPSISLGSPFTPPKITETICPSLSLGENWVL